MYYTTHITSKILIMILRWKVYFSDEFHTQSCFMGRYGTEAGQDMFGVQIIIHAPQQNQNTVHVCIT